MPPRLAALLLALLAIALPAGCGDSSLETDGTRAGTVTDEVQSPRSGPAPVGASARSCVSHASDAADLRATGIACEEARRVVNGWRSGRGCTVPVGSSRASCLSRSYRCQAARTDRGLAVSCAREGRSIAFVARP